MKNSNSEMQQKLHSRWVEVGRHSVFTRMSENHDKNLPVVIIVPGLAVSTRYMIPLARELSDNYQVYSLDFPGFGKSSKPSHVLNIHELSDVLFDWMNVLKIKSAVLVANSFGCQVTADFALRYPTKVNKLVFISPTIDPEKRSATKQIWSWIKEMPRQVPAHGFINAIDYKEAGPSRFLKTFKYALADEIEEKLPRIKVPILIIRGEQDPLVSQDWVELVRDITENSQLEVISGASHTANFTHPKDVREKITHFIGGKHS